MADTAKRNRASRLQVLCEAGLHTLGRVLLVGGKVVFVVESRWESSTRKRDGFTGSRYTVPQGTRHRRTIELELLTLAYNSSTQVKPVEYLGASRDLLASVDLLTAQYRYSHRIPRTAAFTAVFPDWAKDLVRHSARGSTRQCGPAERAGDQRRAGRDWFDTRNVNVIWTLDGLKAGTYGTGGSAITNQFFGLMASNAPEPQWPGQSTDAAFMLAWLLYPEGTLQFLDGGRLDLGVVRDSTLDATNDYEAFVETFESVAFRGLEAYQVQSTILPNGGSAGTVAVSGYHE